MNNLPFLVHICLKYIANKYNNGGHEALNREEEKEKRMYSRLEAKVYCASNTIGWTIVSPSSICTFLFNLIYYQQVFRSFVFFPFPRIKDSPKSTTTQVLLLLLLLVLVLRTNTNRWKVFET